MMKLFTILIFISALPVFISCDDSLTSQDVDNREIPDSNVSYSLHLVPVLELKCTGCHNTTRMDGGVDLSSWAGVTNPNILVVGNSETSILVWTVERRAGFAPMPPTPLLPLTPDQIRGLKTWIDEGAKNN
jgi:hypothetical protein